MTEIRMGRGKALMDTAITFAKRSTCERNHVGAVLSRNGRILTTGYNGAPAGMDHCYHSYHYMDIREESDEFIIARRKIWDDDACLVSVHAEANAIAFAARYGINTDGSVLYVTVAPCLSCAQILINAGVICVVYLNPYRITTGIELLTSAGIKVTEYS